MESRRSLAILLGIRGRAAVRWQEDVSGEAVAVGMDAAGKVLRADETSSSSSAAAAAAAAAATAAAAAAERERADAASDRVFTDDDVDDDGVGDEGAPGKHAINSSWSQLAEARNRQPVTIGLGLCVLAAFSGSNTVIYYASTVLKEVGSSNHTTRDALISRVACP